MLPHSHFLFAFLIGLIFTKLGFFSWKFALFCGIIAVLVDLDHYVEHILHAKKDKFSIRATWNNSIKLHKFNQRSFIHHFKGAIFLTVLFAALYLINAKIALVLAIGYYSHLLLDLPPSIKDKIMRLKLGKWYFNEKYLEIIFDIVILIIIFFLKLFS